MVVKQTKCDDQFRVHRVSRKFKDRRPRVKTADAFGRQDQENRRRIARNSEAEHRDQIGPGNRTVGGLGRGDPFGGTFAELHRTGIAFCMAARTRGIAKRRRQG